MSSQKSWRIAITGCIQGIGFRPFVFRMAHEANIKGRVANLGDGRVEIRASGNLENLEKFERLLHKKKPELAVYDTFQKEIPKESYHYDTFQISKSKTGSKKPSASYIPPDLSICDECVQEIKDENLPRRYHYPFTSCVNCGPRYTIIHELPYDRPLTEMENFPFCNNCKNEYQDPFDRRFHAQTTCCTKCGPEYSLYVPSRDEPLEIDNLIDFVAQEIKKGKIIAIKGIGGTHLACDPFNDDVIARLRERKGERKEKPFALMAASIDEIKKHAYVDDQDEAMLTSLRRPILILHRKEKSTLSKLVSPKLHNLGFMLPYSGLHYLLLWAGLPVLIMTSANLSKQPMLISNSAIRKKLTQEELADYFLLHNRKIYQRCDDSVIRSYKRTNNLQLSPLFIRRSRGFTPEPIDLHESLGNKIVFATGAEMHTTAALAVKGKVFQTQYLGTVSYLQNWNFWKSASQHLKSLLNVTQPEMIVSDLHPSYETTLYAKNVAERLAIPLTQVQHHHAHAAAIMVDNEMSIDDEMLTVALDGVGYGEDGNIWGGEILAANYKNFEQIATIKSFPLPGGDLATKYPIRSAIGILYSGGWDKKTVFEALQQQIQALPQQEQEFDIIWQQLEKEINTPHTSSTGRVLDAASAILDVTTKQTYEGSPAIQLESAGIPHKDNTIPFSSSVHGDHLYPATLLNELISLKQSHPRSKLAASFQMNLARDLVDLTARKVNDTGIKSVGLSGGVAVNFFIRKLFHKGTTYQLFEQKKLPPGDGGISVGQSAVGLARLMD